MRVLYFAWLRAKTGIAEETVEPPAEVGTVGELARWLEGRSAGHAAAFADLAVVKVAVNQEFADFDHPVCEGDEIAFFPPVTGG